LWVQIKEFNFLTSKFSFQYAFQNSVCYRFFLIKFANL
jgi:hypothetical protein